MTPPSDDDPTRRIPAGRPRAAVPGEPAGPTWQDEFADRLRSLRTAVTLLAILSVVALGVAVFAVLNNDDDSGGNNSSAASKSSVSALEDRVDKLESSSSPSASDVSDLQDSVERLDTRLNSLEDSAATGDDIQSLQQDVADLKQQVEQLQQQSP